MFSRKLFVAVGLAATLTADLPSWISTIEIRTKLEEIFYSTVTFGANSLAWRKPPKETRPALTQQIQQSPADAQLYYLRAREAEAQLDFAAAEADWDKFTQIAPNRAQAWIDKADFHHRRAEPGKELAALLEAAKLPAAGAEIYRPITAQQSWLALERAASLIPDHLLSDDRALDVLRAREARFPNEPQTYTRFAYFLATHQRWGDLEALLARYQLKFPGDETWTLQTRATIERGRNGAAGAVALYDRAYRPDWGDALLTDYFRILDETDSRRRFVATARQRQSADPAAVEPASRLFHHYRLSGDTASAQRVLHDLTKAHSGRWTPAENLLLAGYDAIVQNPEEAARGYYAAFTSSDANASEQGLAELIGLLISQAAQPFRFAGGDLSFYRDIATLDSNPGFWNGILSLVLNGQNPSAELSEQERKAVPYFHRAAAAELLRVFDSRFAQSPRRAALHAQVIEASSLHAESDRVVRLGTAFLAAFPNAAERPRIALLTADAHARLNQTQPEFALYDALLNELGARAGRVPIGDNAGAPRNPEYPRILDRYIARLVAVRQPALAMALYRREIDRNPNDPGLYERLAAFLEQNKITGEVEATYRRAIQQFPDKSWSHKLARFFLRQKMTAQFDAFSREVSAAFSGTELEQYLTAASQQGALDPVLFRQVNLYAYRRFPHHIPFVKNLLSAYANRATADPVEWERLLRANWVFDETLRIRFFEYLSRTNKLDAEIAALQPQTNTNQAAALLVAEGELWKGHFESAAPLLRKVAADFPADSALITRTAAVHRSLNQIGTAIQLEEGLSLAHPADTATLTRLGEMQAEQERYDRAGAYWNKIIALAPGRPANYLEVATLHWDYYQYNEAIAHIEEGRRKLNNPRLFAFETAAIRENQGDLAAAAREYVSGAAEEGDQSNSRQRLIKVATRPAWRQPLESALTAAGNNAKTLALRVALLESQSRKQDIESLLTQAVTNAGAALLSDIRQHAQRSGLANVERRILDRQYALATEPANKMALLAERIRFEEAANAQPAAAQFADTLLRENPRSVGAIRTAVNYHWRSGSKPRAADILLASAPNAYPELGRSFRLEAIRKLSDAGDYARAHREAATLLAANPLDEQVIALKAEAFSRAREDAALSTFYRDTLAAFQKANRPTAALRRAWIPALIRLNDSTGAADQYIELLKQFSEDEVLQREAARFAAGSGQRERITAYFAKAESDSPRDARWPIVRARLENEFGDFNAALAAWGRAVALRPERVDLLSSRAKLEERLSQFDRAVASYRKLFEISFKNAAWLEEGARVLARQGKNEECVKWLREAYIDNRSGSPDNALLVASRLLELGLTEQGRVEVQKALPSATDVELAGALYSRAATRLRQYDTIVPTLSAVTARLTPDRQRSFRRLWLTDAAMNAGNLYTPEEKQRFGTWLEAQRATAGADTVAAAALQTGLADLAAKTYAQAMMAAPGTDNANAFLEELTRLQTQRQQFGELGRQVEAYHRVLPNADEKTGLLRRARQAYFAAGDDTGELRILSTLQTSGAIAEDERDRLFELSTRRAPATLTARQTQDAAFMDTLANYALRTGKAPIVTQAIANRRAPLWQNAARAITGLYLGENTPAVRKAFIDSIGPERIGDKLALAGNRDATLAGDVWFYYAGRYGAWLQLAQDANSPHYLAALVERRANSAGAYLDLGAESSGATAEQAYKTALILDEHQPIAYARLAALAQSKPEKAQLYRRAVDELRWWQDNRRVQEWFWMETARVLREAGAAGLNADIRDNVDTLIRAYVKRNGAYRVRELLEGALALAGDPAAGVQWIAQISRSAADPASFLAQLNNEAWLPAAGRETLLKLQMDFAIDRFNRATGDERSMTEEAANSARIRYASYLLKANRAAAARPVVMALLASPELRTRFDINELQLLLAIAEKRVDAVLPTLPREPETLRNLATNLRAAGLNAEARTVLFAAYNLDLQNGNVDSAIPGLAALHIEAGTPEKALPLLDVYVMQADTPFARHLTAGDLFLRNSRKAEAVRYLEPLVAAEPWNRNAKALLAEARDDEAALTALAADGAATYKDRLRAATWIGANKPKALNSGSGELDFLARNAITDVASEQPLWAEARRVASFRAKNEATVIRLNRAILAIDPKDDQSALKLFRALLQIGRPREASSAIEDRLQLINTNVDRARLADCYVRTNQLPRALNMFEQIFDIGPPDQTVRWQNAYNTVRAQAARDEQNQLRRPVVAEELEQRNLVKPRLVAAQGGAR